MVAKCDSAKLGVKVPESNRSPTGLSYLTARSHLIGSARGKFLNANGHVLDRWYQYSKKPVILNSE